MHGGLGGCGQPVPGRDKGVFMDERKRIEEKIRELAEGEEERGRCLGILDEAFRALEEGNPGKASEKLGARLDSILDELKRSAGSIKDMVAN